MGDPRAVVPYNDPHDVSSLYSAEHNLFHDENPSLFDIYNPLTAELSPNCHPYPPSEYQNGIPNPPWGKGIGDGCSSCNVAGPSGSNTGAGPSLHADETPNLNRFKPLAMWPEPPCPYTCSFCFILREIVHTNGTIITRLELHGRLGMISHAVLENRHFNGQLDSSAHRHQMIDFCKKSIVDVKLFLEQYCEERHKAGFVMLPDPLSLYYEAVCTGFNWDEAFFDDGNDFFEYSGGSAEHTEDACNIPTGNAHSTGQQSTEVTRSNEALAASKTSLAMQRERTGKLTLMDLAGYFHLPIEVAAQRLNLCPTVVKRISRRGGLKRWPHRKIKSIERQISKLQPMLTSRNHNDKAFAELEVERLQKQIAAIRYGLPPAQ